MWWTILILGWVIFVVWAVALVPSAVMLHRRTLPRETATLPEPDSWPLVSVIVAARDEAEHVEAGLRSISASDYPNLEIIAVNDRSRDATGTMMDELAAGDARLQVLHVTKLPEGWLGKTHALHVAAQAARGEFLLFTDADVMFEPDSIRISIKYADHKGVDHLCLMPQMISGGYWENALVAYFGVMMVFAVQIWLVPTMFRWSYIGIGAFNLVRREAYASVGGHQPIRLDVLDDVKLGKMMKRSRFRQDFLLGGDRLRVRWQPSAWGVICGLEKNAFAALDYSIVKLISVTLAFCVLAVFPYAVVAALPDARCGGYAASLILVHVLYAVLGHTFGSGWSVLPAFPLAGLAMMSAFWRSAVITLRQGGVCWRDTFYPLATLREHLYR